jgi:uncharacterized protein YraI
MRAFLTLMIILLVAPAAAAQADAVTAAADQTINVRSGPGTQFEIVARLEAGDIVPVDGRDSPDSLWLRVVLANNMRGWVAFFTVTVSGDTQTLPIVEQQPEITPPADALDGEVRVLALGRVNVRSGPAITYEVVSQLEAGDEAQAQARSSETNDWLLIEQAEVVGWVAYFTVTVIGDTASLPVRVPEIQGDGLIPPSALTDARYNARLRAAPSFLAAVLTVIPFGAQVQPLARSADARWLYLAYDGVQGWSLTQLFALSPSAADRLPVSARSGRPFTLTPTPETTPESE